MIKSCQGLDIGLRDVAGVECEILGVHYCYCYYEYDLLADSLYGWRLSEYYALVLVIISLDN